MLSFISVDTNRQRAETGGGRLLCMWGVGGWGWGADICSQTVRCAGPQQPGTYLLHVGHVVVVVAVLNLLRVDVDGRLR